VPGPLHKGGENVYLFITVEYRARIMIDQTVSQTGIQKLRSCLWQLQSYALLHGPVLLKYYLYY